MTQKKCARCGIVKDISEFYAEKYISWCKECRKEHRKLAPYKKYNREYQYYYMQDPEHKKRHLEWIANHREHLREQNKARYQREKPKWLKASRLRKLRMANIPGSHTEPEWQDLLYVYDHKCFGCGEADCELTRDHIIPITRGGSDDITNISPLCRRCNSRKNNKGAEWYMETWAAQKGMKVKQDWYDRQLAFTVDSKEEETNG